MRPGILGRAALIGQWVCAIASGAEALQRDRGSMDGAAGSSSLDRDEDRHGALIPDFVKLQTGGYAGLIAIGTGYAGFDDVLNVGLAYGYVPAAVAGDTVHSLHLAVDVRPFELQLRSVRSIPVYAGVGLLHTWGSGYFVSLPDRYPAGYYPPTALHVTVHLGTELDLVLRSMLFERHGVYAELRSLEVFARRYFRNPEMLGPGDVIAVALGYRVALR